ncbi:hypothetical protein OH77DRAFT_251822 [Trametes cingulata]|nr:hypothetical protein OH77DRAFT_251822 [Trametes cingulata]
MPTVDCGALSYLTEVRIWPSVSHRSTRPNGVPSSGSVKSSAGARQRTMLQIKYTPPQPPHTYDAYPSRWQSPYRRRRIARPTLSPEIRAGIDAKVGNAPFEVFRVWWRDQGSWRYQAASASECAPEGSAAHRLQEREVWKRSGVRPQGLRHARKGSSETARVPCIPAMREL